MICRAHGQPFLAGKRKRLSVFFDYPVEIRKAIYTTNAIESLNASLRKITKTRRSFQNDEAVMAQLEIMYQDRI